MKKSFKTILIPTVFTILLLLSFNVNINCNKNQITNISIQNIEALADAENDLTKCWGIGSLDCPENNSKVKLIY